jgi:hypothetical protein
MYDIKPYSYEKAHELGLDIKPSKRKHKKIDIYKDGDYICSIGDNRYMDYPSFLERDGYEIAELHRQRYHNRHKKDLNYLKGFLSLYILW